MDRTRWLRWHRNGALTEQNCFPDGLAAKTVHTHGAEAEAREVIACLGAKREPLKSFAYLSEAGRPAVSAGSGARRPAHPL